MKIFFTHNNLILLLHSNYNIFFGFKYYSNLYGGNSESLILERKNMFFLILDGFMPEKYLIQSTEIIFVIVSAQP